MKQETEKPQSQRTAEEFFEQFADALGYDCCEEHRAEARKVFLSGFAAAMHFVTAVAHEIEDPKAMNERMRALHSELSVFSLEMLANALARRPRAKLPVASDAAQPGHN